MDIFRLPSGAPVARVGQGAWQIGEDHRTRAAELRALNVGLELGMNLIDTAEMYGSGRSEQLIARVITEERREDMYIVSKVLPENAAAHDTLEACKRTLERLDTDYLDLYLLHWRGDVPLEETLDAFMALREVGLIRYYGVSNFDVDDLTEAQALPSGVDIATNQVLYNLEERGVEWNLLPWCRQHNMPLMAYSPLGSDSRRLRTHPVLEAMAARLDATPSRIALAWLLRQPDVLVIPKASSEAHVRDNHAALKLELTDEDLAVLDRTFPPPKRAAPLAMI